MYNETLISKEYLMGWFYHDLAYTGVRVKEIINRMPKVEAVPIVHGEWKIDEFGHYCSACKKYANNDYQSLYCPECGAKMDLGE